MIAVVCPRCLGELARTPDALECSRCPHRYPVVAGIPDLRLSYPDPYLTWERDVELARELEARAQSQDLAGLLREHWRMSGKHPELAERFAAVEFASAAKSEAYLEEIEHERGRTLEAGDAFLEIGCGTAALAAAAARRGAAAVASDISMRWLVLARKRLDQEGLTGVALVCCAAEELPFADESFDVVAASDVIEHTDRQGAFVAGCARALRRDGRLFLATPNRYSLGLEPHVRLWGVGFLPRPLARRYVRTVRKAPYDHVRLLSAPALRRLLAEQGLDVRIVPPRIPPATQRLYSGLEARLVRLYNRLRSFAPARLALLAVGPFFHVFARKGAS